MKVRSTLLILLGVLLLNSCERAVIPESRFEDIYHDILLADSYVCGSSSLVTSTDSIVVYQSIIENYGYTIEQFVFAQNFYLAHPERFTKIMNSLQERFNKELGELQESEVEKINTAIDSAGHIVKPKKSKVEEPEDL